MKTFSSIFTTGWRAKILKDLILGYQRMLNNHFLIISLGALFGANARYWIGGWAAQKFGASFPYGSMIINLTGSFLLGLFMSFVTDRFLIDPRWRVLIAIGFFGSFTTFSSYTYESMNLILEGQLNLGLFNLIGSAVLGGLAVILGIWLGQFI